MPWVKGQSGNPTGRPRKGKTLAEVVRKRTGKDGRKIVEEVERLAFGRHDDARIRLDALKWLADRGYGKVIEQQQIEHRGEIGHTTTVVHEYHPTVGQPSEQELRVPAGVSIPPGSQSVN